MIDLHTHILPRLDHGPASWEEAVSMARMAAGDGITMLAATPHVNFEFRPKAADILAAAAAFRERLTETGVNLKVVAGADYLLTPELVSPDAEILTLGDNGHYFLLEFPPMVVPPNAPGILRRFLDRGLTPIITHPERNGHLCRHPGLLEEMVGLGCPVQLTAGSLTGMFGEQVQADARKLLAAGLCHVLASDAHWEKERPPILSHALPLVTEIVGAGKAEALVTGNPLRILDGKPLPR